MRAPERSSTPTPITRTRAIRGTRRTSAVAAAARCSRWRARAPRAPRRSGVPAGAHLAHRVRLPDEPARPLRRLARAAGPLYRRVAARRVYVATKVDMLIHYLYLDEPELARWQSGLVDQEREAEARASTRRCSRSRRSRGAASGRPSGARCVPETDRSASSSSGASAASGWTSGALRGPTRRGYFRRTIRARKRTEIRLCYPTKKVASVAARRAVATRVAAAAAPSRSRSAPTRDRRPRP